MRTEFKRSTAGGENPTVLVIVSCPASIIVLQMVNAGILEGCVEIMLTELGR